MKNRIFNKTFWKFLTGFLVVIAVSLFMIIIVGSFESAPLDAEDAEQEECLLFC